jgi:hypothetical protein
MFPTSISSEIKANIGFEKLSTAKNLVLSEKFQQLNH